MILLAPMQGLTDYSFRNVYSRHYGGIDEAISPFISLVKGEKGKPRIARDVSPANNQCMPVIPQILGNDSTLFMEMAKFLEGWGYNKINWNLGCPVRNVTRKKRGSGLIPYPELIREILERIIPIIPQTLSVKIRLGLNRADEVYKLIEVLNEFPLENIIVHPRIGAQMYEGKVMHSVMAECFPLFKHEVIYNGDIFSISDFKHIQALYPSIHKWMLGRGVFYNPLLPSLMKGEQAPSKEKACEVFLSFIFDLYNEWENDKHIHLIENKMKMFWHLFSVGFNNEEQVFEKIKHASGIEEIKQITLDLIEKELINRI